MYINCWSYKSYEDIPLEYKDHAMIFVDDTPTGTKVECGYCHEEIIIVPSNGDGYFRHGDKDSCPLCDGNLIYGRVDW